MLKRPFRKNKVLLCLLAVVFAALTAASGVHATPQDVPPSTIGLPAGMAPSIEFKETNYDFGTVTEGDKVTHVFKFRNSGEGMVLTIKKVQPTCGCTAALLTSDVIAPGGKGEVKITFNSRGFHGKVKKTIRVKSDDPAKPLVQLHLTGEVIKKKEAK